MSGRPEETTAVSTIDTARGVLRYRDRDVADLVATVRYEDVWGLLVDGRLHPALPAAEPFPFHAHTGDCRVDAQTAIAQLAPVWGYRSVLDITRERLREDLGRAVVLAFAFVARAARGEDLPTVSQREVDAAEGFAGQFLARWRGEVRREHVTALDAYLTAVAEHGLTPSTRTARLGAARGADAAACLSAAVAVSSGPLGGGMGVRALALLDAADRQGADRAVREALDDTGRLWGFGQAGWSAPDPRAVTLRDLCRRLDVPRLAAAEELERTAGEAIAERSGGPLPHGANAMFWGSVLLDYAEVPARMFPALFACGRAAGWSAHILEQVASPHPHRVP